MVCDYVEGELMYLEVGTGSVLSRWVFGEGVVGVVWKDEEREQRGRFFSAFEVQHTIRVRSDRHVGANH